MKEQQPSSSNAPSAFSTTTGDRPQQQQERLNYQSSNNSSSSTGGSPSSPTAFGANLQTPPNKSINHGKDRWDETCFVYLRQSTNGRNNGSDPKTSIICFQRRTEPDGSESLIYKSTTDFLSALQQVVSMVGEDNDAFVNNPATEDIMDDLSTFPPPQIPTVSILSPQQQQQQRQQPHQQPNNPAAYSPQNPQPVHSQTSATFTRKSTTTTTNTPTNPKTDEIPPPQEFTVQAAKAYIAKIYQPHVKFFRTYGESLWTGKAFGIVGKFTDAVWRGEPVRYARLMGQKGVGWANAAMNRWRNPENNTK